MRTFLSVLLSVLPLILAAQNPHPTAAFWQNIKDSDVSAESADRLIIPQVYRALRLDFSQIKTLLLTAPTEADLRAGEAPLDIALPLPSGGFERFQVWQAPVMHPDMAAQYPTIRTYMGRGLDRPQVLVRLDHTPAGFHAMMLGTSGGQVFIDPYARGNSADYVCYFKKDFSQKSGDLFACGVESPKGDTAVPTANQNRAGDCGKLRKYRLALACTGEYALFHGAVPGNRAPALAAMVVSMNRVNGVFERDAAIRMVMVSNDSLLIYTNPATDPYTNNNGGTMLDENQTTCDNVIGTANYDVGHVFSTGGGGVAYLQAPCNASIKAGGVTGSGNPVGDPFDIDYVAHEMGHQFGGNHTQYNPCNRNNGTAVEPGSASTIMGYAGICAPNVQSNSDAYFHSTSLLEIGAFVTGTGNTCATIETNTNTAPTLPTVSSRTIPKSTPFFLTATASDAQNDPLTFCWEQRDNNGTTTNNPQPPESTNTQGPMFRSYNPVSSGTRYFPKFADVLSGFNDDWEELPSVGRDLRMRVMVRDNNTDGGCTTNQNMTVTVNGTAGPFVVTKPNTVLSFAPGATDTVKWNVAGTTAAPISCANVDILISTDGGATFSNLVSNTPNDGSQIVTYPNILSDECRIMVRSVGNVFYDVSDENFLLSNLQIYCNVVYISTDVPKNIEDNTTSTSTLNINTAVSGSITDLDVVNLAGTHTWINDVTITLQSPSGTERTLFDQICDDEDNFAINFNDEATNAYSSIPCPPIGNGTYKPNETLAGFDGENPDGTWTLHITDHVPDDNGVLNSWGLNLCILAASPPAPVELQSFTANLVTDATHLEWITATERDNRGFHIERSVGNAFDFKTIGWIPGNGTTTERHHYQFDDRNLRSGQLHYYRLRQEDHDGRTELSDVEVVSVGQNAGLLHTFPNPVSKWLNIQLPPSLEADVLQISVWDTEGRSVLNGTLKPGSPLNVETLPAGVYWVQVVAEEEVWRGKLVKK